ncbi:response regulator transcription factor [Fusibacter bizertensis]
MKQCILIVEDQIEIRNVVEKYLLKEDYIVHTAENGFVALEKFNQFQFHLVILDVMMPGINGFEVLEQIRNNSDIPVLMLTAKEQEADRIKGFDLGADDYVVKPFSPRELVRRVQVILKRTYKEFQEDDCLVFDRLKLCAKNMKLYKDNQEIAITATEYHLMRVFIQNKGIILSRDQLIRLAFGVDYDGFDRNIDSYIKRLRQKIETDSKQPKYLVTKYGVGYMFGGEI